MRRITVASERPPSSQKLFPNNRVSSTHYSCGTLVPQSLFEQFQRSSNCWFLLVSMLQLLPVNLNVTDSWTTVLPLVILLSFTLLKDAYSDYYRHKHDSQVNLMQYSA